MNALHWSKAILVHRLDKKLTRDQLAELIDGSVSAIRKWERGESAPSLENFIRLVAVLGPDLLELIFPDEIQAIREKRLDAIEARLSAIEKRNQT